MLKKIVFVFFIVVFIAGGIYWYMYFQKLKTPISDGINSIPTNAAFIIESKQSKNTWKKLSQTNIMWEELISSDLFADLNTQGHYIDSVLSANPAISKLLENHSFFISAHSTSADNYHFLFTYSLPNLTHQSELEELLEKINNGKQPDYREFQEQSIGTIQTSKGRTLNFSFINGILVFSFDASLVEASIQQLKEGKSLSKDIHFNSILNSSGKNVDANIFLNYKMFPSVLQTFIHPSFKNEMGELANFAEYSGWDVTINPNALMLNGFTYVNDSSTNFLNIFRNQKPQTTEVVKVAPSKTAMMLFYGISNFKTYIKDYNQYAGSKQKTNVISELNNKYGIAIEDSFAEWFDNEMALIVTETDMTDIVEHSYAYLHSNDVNEAMLSLNKMAENINKMDTLKVDTLTFKNHFINKMSIPNLIPQFLGWQFNKIEAGYFTNIDNYIVFGNSAAALQNVINDFENNKTLANDKNYQVFAENISSESNVYLYSSLARSTGLYSDFLNEEQKGKIKKNEELLKKFESLAFQYTSSDKLFYSNGYLKYNPSYKKEVETLWESKLDSTISTKPHIVLNHTTKSKEIFVQDDANKIYLISNTGKILWRKQLKEKIISDIIQVDALKNNKLQLLFNTPSAIYLLDRNGNEMKGFPLLLNATATNGISVFDYDKNKDYRIFIATADKNVACFKINGEKVTGFEFDKTNEQVVIPIHFAEINGKDHLFIVDVKGKIYIINRQGETKIKLKEKLPQAIKSFEVEPGKDYSKTYLIAADTLGNVVKISLSNDKERLKFQDFETSPYFLYQDINNDKIKEYIFLSRDKLSVFSQDNSPLFSYSFEAITNQVPVVFTFPDGEVKIGVVIDATGQLYLINSDGNLYNGFPLKGNTMFSIADLNNEGDLHLITGSNDNSIYVYHLE